ncbi:MAG: S8 family serine peptidase [Elusimicrobia bacterium]|nr:S8 family serine peptidase [Elusimicrobiota bacterium]
MKRLLSLSLSLSLLSSTAFAQMRVAVTVAPVTGVPVMSPVVAGPQVAPGGNALTVTALNGTMLPRPAVLRAAPANSGTGAARTAQPGSTGGELAKSLTQTADGAPTAFGQSLNALAAPALNHNDMGSTEASGAAGNDFQTRARLEANNPGGSDGEVELLVSVPDGSGRQATEDVYPMGLAKPGLRPQAVEAALFRQLNKLGIEPQLLAANKARAIGVVSRINTAVLKVSEQDMAILWAELEARGLKVQRGRQFEVPKPMAAEPNARTVGLKETAAIYGADKLQAKLREVLGDPETHRPTGVLARVFSTVKQALGLAVKNPVLPWAVLDTWVAVAHPYIKGRMEKETANNPDSETHGSHTAGTVIGMDPWNFSGRVYNIFPGGSASESDILFKLNKAQEEGALATTNSWGDGSGNPEGAIEKLFIKGSEKGIHHSISAGNSGSRANTIGGPAIVYHNVDLVVNGKVIGKVKRIKAIAAADADKNIAYFSSRGPGSRTTARDPEKYKNWPVKPDETGMGVNLVAPVPSGPTVPELGGPGASMSGTSMSNPGVFGTFLLLTRGILVLLKDYLPAVPNAQQTQFAMDLARWAMTETAEKKGAVNDFGDGFINVWSAFQLAEKTLKENPPQKVAPAHLRGSDFGPWLVK